jgi:aarF domain-containing kinase
MRLHHRVPIRLQPYQKVMKSSLGSEYQNIFTHFESVPFAAASIGQVHAARLSPEHSPTGREEDVVVKVGCPLLFPT